MSRDDASSRAEQRIAGRLWRSAGAVAAALGVLLLMLAVPRLASGLMVAPYSNVASDLARGDVVELARLRRGIRAHERALAVYDSPRERARLGELYYAAAHFVGPQTAEGTRLLDQAIAAHRRALAESPALPYSWSQLAVALYGRAGGSDAFRAAFREAIRAAPRTPQLVLAHTRLGLRTWVELDAELRDMVVDQLSWAVTSFPRRLTRGLERPLDLRLGLSLLADRPVLRCRLAAAWQARAFSGCTDLAAGSADTN